MRTASFGDIIGGNKGEISVASKEENKQPESKPHKCKCQKFNTGSPGRDTFVIINSTNQFPGKYPSQIAINTKQIEKLKIWRDGRIDVLQQEMKYKV